MLTFKNITKKFGEIVALSNVSFEVKPGELVFITGPSGAGKTTVLRLILHEITPDSGDILLSNKSILKLKKRELPFFRRQIGVVFQDYKLLFDRTIGENVSLVLAVTGVSSSQQAARAREVLAYVGLGDRVNAFPSQLAGGELQRAVIARALSHNPKLLLADEPTGNLDPETSWGIMKLLQEINKKGTTILMATHNQNIVDEMKRHVIVIGKGKVVSDKENGKYKE